MIEASVKRPIKSYQDFYSISAMKLKDILTNMFTIIGSLCLLISLCSNAEGMKNPAAVYCEEMGYKYELKITTKGEGGVCIINEKEFDAWEFLEGKAGKEYSYCEKNGYAIIAERDEKNPYSKYCAVCISRQTKENTKAKAESTRIKMIDLMKLNEKIDSQEYVYANDIINENEKKRNLLTTRRPVNTEELPNHFDWREKDSKNWMTPVKDQRSSGVCIIFAEIGLVEAKIKIETNNPDSNPDLSEQQIYSCPGGYGYVHGSFLRYIKDKGVVDEECFPYANAQIPCDLCENYRDKLTRIIDYYAIGDSSWNDIDSTTWIRRINTTKKTLIEKGPLYTTFYMSGYFDENNIYKCDEFDNKHAGVIVGYRDTGDVHTSYWILKNSWGANWNGDGYFKMGWDMEYPGYEGIYSAQCRLDRPTAVTAINKYEKYGDINNSGTIDLEDAVLTLQILCNMDINNDNVTIDADINDDGKIGLEEEAYILKKISKDQSDLLIDSDNDGIYYEQDNCPNTYNPGQEDSDGDKIGDACEHLYLTAPIPDTGQTNCYNNSEESPCPPKGDAFYGQDASYNINPPSYTKLDTSGNPVQHTATEWAMVQDNVTGLIWEIKNQKGGGQDYNNPHDADNKYTWYDSTPETNRGNEGTPGDGNDTEDFINALNEATFGGFNDWRLPTQKELQSIVDYSKHKPTVNTDYFSNIIAHKYWSSSTNTDDKSRAGAMSFYGGSSLTEKKSAMWYVRAVRGKPPDPGGSLIVNGDGTVTDITTGLMWQQDTAHDGLIGMTWQDALSYCEDLTLGNYNDWRLPTVSELLSIINLVKHNFAIHTKYFPNTEIVTYYWTSTTSGNLVVNGDGTMSYFDRAWTASFRLGTSGSGSRKWKKYFMRAVRGASN